MIIDAYATDTVPSHEVRRRALEALANEGEPMSEVTYDALCKRLTQTAAEIERLRAENEHLATSNHAYLSGYQEAIAEIEKLRAALRKIADTDPDEGTSWFHDVANAALGEKE